VQEGVCMHGMHLHAAIHVCMPVPPGVTYMLESHVSHVLERLASQHAFKAPQPLIRPMLQHTAHT
jgi:hypothetical protein